MVLRIAAEKVAQHPFRLRVAAKREKTVRKLEPVVDAPGIERRAATQEPDRPGHRAATEPKLRQGVQGLDASRIERYRAAVGGIRPVPLPGRFQRPSHGKEFLGTRLG